MTQSEALRAPYLPHMFAWCMVLMTVFTVCAVAWLIDPVLPGHMLLQFFVPGFETMSLGVFALGFILAGIYGNLLGAVYVFFFNLWPALWRVVFGGSP
ncbi:MAG: hypothetical protein SFV19_12360 [Rhodospirillaceae bacterium]|nr:hypothetical protein [Rhodospirillaceae bacterium]